MNARTVYSGRFLRVTDLRAKRTPARIQAVEEQEFGEGRDREKKLTVTFREFEKPLVLNRTNCDVLIDLTGSAETDDWIDKRVVLLQAKVNFQGKNTPCIRIEEPGELEVRPDEEDADTAFLDGELS
ncbi:MAG: hypothetical protein H0W08_24340 [Acidobacteria bacterium]|nr:hypothetical protein [Acidobacteriota bacterium]